MLNCLRNADCWKVSPLSGTWCDLYFVNIGASHMEPRKLGKSITLASWIIVYIRVFILRKFSDLYGLIWVYTLIWNSPFHPIRILFKSIRFLYGGKVNKDVKFPPKISFTKSNEGKSHGTPWLCGQLPLILLKTHIFITKVTSPHGQSNISSILVTISSTESCIFSKHMARKQNGNPPGQQVHRRPSTLHYLWIVKISWYSSH